MNKSSTIWYIANDLQTKFERESELFFTNIKPIPLNGTTGLFLDGYVTPRLSIYSEHKYLSQIDLIATLYNKHALDFIKYIKGCFVIILLDKNSFYIFNDIHGIKKYFIYQNNGKFIISNSLKFIFENTNASLNKENAVIYCLMEHYVDGMTLFNNVSYSKSASVLYYKNKISVTNYWLPDELIKNHSEYNTIDLLTTTWKGMIQNYIEYLKPTEIAMTLTGGNDSRMILAGLLSSHVHPNCFTFGDPLSEDVIVAKSIAEKVNLKYNNYFAGIPSREWFETYSQKIISSGNSLVNIHRAHRMFAIEGEIKNHPYDEMILAGFMGGDYTKGIIYDDYITSKLMRLWKYDDSDNIAKIAKLMQQYCLKKDAVQIENIKKKIESLPYFNDQLPYLVREFYYIHFVIGCTHDWQDTKIFDLNVKYVVNPFMDIDFLEALFSSKYSMFYKDNSKDGFIKKLSYPELHVKVSHALSPILSSIPYAKRGYYSNDEYLGNTLIYFLKRAWRYKEKKKYPQNFPLESWMREYVLNEITNIDGEIQTLFEIKNLKKILDKDLHPSTEEYWHLFTNIINLSKNYSYYTQTPE